MKRMLVITTGFKRSGAPIALYGLLKLLIERNKYTINIIAYEDGELLPDYERLVGSSGIEIIEGLSCTNEFRSHLQNDYDIILLNTVAVYPFSMYFQNLNIPVYWWLHEAPEMIEESFQGFPNPHLLSPNFHLFTSSAGSQKKFSQHYSYSNVSSLPVPIFPPETLNQEVSVSLPEDKINFIIPGAYTFVKGQDLLLKAISCLPEDFANKAYFIFCGYSLKTQSEYKNIVSEMASKLDNVLLLENLPQEEVYALMNRCHCVIAPSRIDTIPMTIVEGMMFNKISLVSNETGISYYMQDCRNGFVFKDHDELVKRLLLIINDCSSLKSIADNGNKIYHDFFSPSAVASLLNEISL